MKGEGGNLTNDCGGKRKVRISEKKVKQKTRSSLKEALRAIGGGGGGGGERITGNKYEKKLIGKKEVRLGIGGIAEDGRREELWLEERRKEGRVQ